MQRFSVYNNRVAGTIPTKFWTEWRQLRMFDVESNMLSGLAFPEPNDNLINWGLLESYRVSNNAFTGTIPHDALVNLRSLRQFWAGGNEIIGTIPASIGSLTPLRTYYSNPTPLFSIVPLKKVTQ